MPNFTSKSRIPSKDEIPKQKQNPAAKAKQIKFHHKIPPPICSLLFRDFIEQISDALDYLHEYDQNHDGVCHYIRAEALKAVADRHIAKPAATDRARHSRKSDDDDERQSNRADDARQRLDEHHAKDYLRLARAEALRRLDHSAIDLQQSAFDEASDK